MRTGVKTSLTGNNCIKRNSNHWYVYVYWTFSILNVCLDCIFGSFLFYLSSFGFSGSSCVCLWSFSLFLTTRVSVFFVFCVSLSVLVKSWPWVICITAALLIDIIIRLYIDLRSAETVVNGRIIIIPVVCFSIWIHYGRFVYIVWTVAFAVRGKSVVQVPHWSITLVWSSSFHPEVFGSVSSSRNTSVGLKKLTLLNENDRSTRQHFTSQFLGEDFGAACSFPRDEAQRRLLPLGRFESGSVQPGGVDEQRICEWNKNSSKLLKPFQVHVRFLLSLQFTAQTNRKRFVVII